MFHCALSFRGTVISWRRDKAGKHTNTHTQKHDTEPFHYLSNAGAFASNPLESLTRWEPTYRAEMETKKTTTKTKRQIELQKQNIVNITNCRVGQRKPADGKSDQ